MKPAARPILAGQRYRALTYACIAGDHLRPGDVLPQEWCDENAYQIAQLLKTSTIVRLPELEPEAA